MTHQQLLQELKDIQPPAEPGWWLPGSGHLLSIGLVLVVVALFRLLSRRRKGARLFLAAQVELRRIGAAHGGDGLSFALELSRWLKKTSLAAFPDHRLEARSGQAWLEFLDRCTGDTSFSAGPGRVFGEDIYRRDARVDEGRLLALCSRWLRAVKPQLLRRGRGR